MPCSTQRPCVSFSLSMEMSDISPTPALTSQHTLETHQNPGFILTVSSCQLITVVLILCLKVPSVTENRDETVVDLQRVVNEYRSHGLHHSGLSSFKMPNVWLESVAFQQFEMLRFLDLETCDFSSSQSCHVLCCVMDLRDVGSWRVLWRRWDSLSRLHWALFTTCGCGCIYEAGV